MNVAFNTAVSGMIAAQSQASSAAHNLVVNSQKGEGVIQAVIAVKQAEAVNKASAAMAQVASEMTKSLLDITI